MRKYLTSLLVLYVLLDFGNPQLPGSFEFNPDSSESALHRSHHREMRSVGMTVEPVRMRPDLDRPALSHSRLLVCQMPSVTGWVAPPSCRSRSAPAVDAAGDDD
jgi:hypothetical protein